MKKLLALLLCLAFMICLVACGEAELEEKNEQEEKGTEISQDSTQESGEEHDHNHIGYKGQTTVFAPEALAQIEGKECDFTYEQNDATLYIYNNVVVDNMTFTQAQFSFAEDHNRISCTYTVDDGTEEAPKDAELIKTEVAELLSSCEQSLVALYGEGARSEQHGYELVSWRDHTGNYIILTQINDVTIQVAYYIYAK